MNRSRGFTLVELLVVIAIITILAGIVVPRVTDAIGRARMSRAQSEIKGAELAITKLLADTDKQGIDKLFNPFEMPNGTLVSALALAVENAAGAHIKSAERMYSDILYELLRRGRDADLSWTNPPLTFVPAVFRKLGSSYMEINMDPWGTHPYYFYAGPLTAISNVYRSGPCPFRCYRLTPPELGDPENDPYIYNDRYKEYEDGLMRGNPRADNGPGYPAPKDLPVYIWSYGEDELNNQAEGGGDDVNNWDSAAGWSAFY